jgi:hypothetical protein
VLSDEDAHSPDRARAAIAERGFDGALVMRFVGMGTQVSEASVAQFSPSNAPNGSFWGDWGPGWGSVYEPGYMKSETVMTLESNVYSVTRDTLVWSSRSESLSPSSMSSLLDQVLEATVKEMKRQNLLAAR